VTVREAVAWARRLLQGAGVTEAHLEAELLLAHALGLSRAQLYARLHTPLPSEAFHRFLCLVGRRASREPLAYILGRREFYGLELEVSPVALIPRQETELLVELALTWLKRRRGLHWVADVGTGCGAIALAIAYYSPTPVQVVATDISPSALALAAHNARRLGLEGHVHLLLAHLLTPFRLALHLVVANLPYVPTEELASAPPELRWEPRQALDGGPQGLRVISRLLAQAPSAIRPGGALILELDPRQAPNISHLALTYLPHAHLSFHPPNWPRALLIQT